MLLSTASSAWAKGGYIYEHAGDVKVAVAGSTPRAATDSLPLDDNTIVTTGDRSRAILKFEDGQLVILRSNTSFKINKYDFDVDRAEKSHIFFSLLKGGLRAVTGLIGDRNKSAFKMSTPGATIGIRGTDFMLQLEGEAMYGQVTNGAVAMQTTTGLGLFSAGQSSFMPSPSAAPVVASVPPLTFIQLQVIAAPPPTPAPAPQPGTITPPPTAQALSAIAMGINVPGVNPADMATAMIQVGNNPAVVTVGVINFAPQAAASITTAAVMAVPQDAAAITTAAVTTAPAQAAAITSAAVTAAPAQAAAITVAAVTAAPAQSAAIATAAVTAAPDQAVVIINAVGSALPSQAGPATNAPAPAPAPVLPAPQLLPPATPPASGGGGAASPN